ncbi:DUF4365 domain-containing protein [Streptantibioticus ferralitis]|uniref:DUF4365 domain-containing protein n=1 Tax=Streptantibioticus ferralitis TaxID=236510 RepID=A0ABT5Z6R5_9ACTN|nr:DUF4365 domain-containing protein [Streptantibioticus ferralitis]MDF2259504.1 DUF4365 domain-containing protein [Streptantibioticus ferralitis]
MGGAGHKGDFGEQFVQALAITANLDVSPKPWRDRRGIDWELTYPGRLGARRHPRIVAQVKCWTPNEPQNEDSWRYPLRVHNFNLLSGRDWYEPRFLFLVVVPKDEAEWVDVTPERLLLRQAAYWACFHDDPPLTHLKADTQRKVPVPKANLLTVPALHRLFGQEFRHKLGMS